MKICRLVAFSAMVGGALCCGGRVQAGLLSVDFQNSNGANVPAVTQSGFESFDNTNGGSATYATVAGDVTVALAGADPAIGGLFNRGGVADGGSLAFASVYNDFAFKNGAAGGGGSPQSMTITLSGAGIAADTEYEITFYSYDSDALGGNHSAVFTGAAGTTGSAGPLLWSPALPMTDDQYSTSGSFVSNGSGVITISVTDSFSGATTKTGARLNALEISAAVPEPTSIALAGLGFVVLAGWRRRKR